MQSRPTVNSSHGSLRIPNESKPQIMTAAIPYGATFGDTSPGSNAFQHLLSTSASADLTANLIDALFAKLRPSHENGQSRPVCPHQHLMPM